MQVYIPIIVCLIGLIIYGYSENAKAQGIGKDMFWCGLLVTLIQLATFKLTTT